MNSRQKWEQRQQIENSNKYDAAIKATNQYSP